MIPQARIYVTAIVVLSLLLGLYFYIHSLKEQITTLREHLYAKNMEIANLQLESERCEAAISQQNKAIEEVRTREMQAKKELQAWKNKKPEVKYKVITKIREVKSDECADIKRVINSVRNLDFSSLQ